MFVVQNGAELIFRRTSKLSIEGSGVIRSLNFATAENFLAVIYGFKERMIGVRIEVGVTMVTRIIIVES